MIRVGIVGATGYGGRELLRLLAPHPQVQITALASQSAAGKTVAEVLPAFRKVVDLRFETFDPVRLAQQCDVVFVGVPGKESMAPVAALRAEGVRTIDIGPDFRLKDPQSFLQYYKTPHSAESHLPGAVYGLVAWYRDQIRTADLVAVPGCYPISVITPLRPLLDAPLADVPIVVNAISGVSGAGRSLSDALHYPEMDGNLKAYKLAVHQHIPEIEQELQGRVQIQFTPHIAPLTRGMLSTIVVRLREPIDPAPYFAPYEAEPFIRILGDKELPEAKHVRGSNFCDIGWTMDTRTSNLVIVSAIDNLVGGTAGMAVQCMNLMFGVKETTGILAAGMAP